MRDLGRVLLTGADGFIGRALRVRLRASGVDVVATDVRAGDGVAACDVTDPAAVLDAVERARAATILHCGAVSGPMVMADEPLAVWRINAEGTANVLEAARRCAVPRVVFASSTEVYGSRSAPADEETPPDPGSVYAASKVAAEAACRGFRRQHGVDVVIVRLAWIYGPGRTTPTTLERLLRDALAGRTTAIDGHPDEPTHYLHVDDAVDALLAAATAARPPHDLYNASAGAARPLREVVDTVARLVPGAAATYRAAAPAAAPAAIAAGRMAADLGVVPRVDLAEGLSRTLEHLRQGG